MVKYTCGTTYRYEIPDSKYWKDDMYDTVAELKASTTCWIDCGIVKLEFDENMSTESMKLLEWAVNPTDAWLL